MDMRRNYQRYQRSPRVSYQSDGYGYRMMNNDNYDNSDNSDNNRCLHYYTLAMAYIPEQEFDCLYDTSEALSHGTIFKELNLPFYGSRNGRYR